MPSIDEITEIARPIIDDAISKAALLDRIRTLQEISRFASRAKSAEEVRHWCELNLALIAAVEEHNDG